MKDVWLRFRSSNAFLYTLMAFLTVWFVLRWFFIFDRDNNWLNIILSAEASVATCMILDLQFRSMAHDRATLQKLLESESKITALLERAEN